MRFLVDENVHRGLISFLRKIKLDASPSPKGLSNGRVFALAISEKRILITHDGDFANQIPTVRHPGIILVRIPPQDFEALKNSMKRLVNEKRSPEEFSDSLFLLFADRHKELPFRADKIDLK